MLHNNELPLKKFFAYLDGRTTGPQSYIGELGSEVMQNLELLPIIEFELIEADLIIITKKKLSKDQQYLLDAVNSIITGDVPSNFPNRTVGKLHNARFLNLASRLLRLYMSQDNPSENLKHLVKYIVQVRKVY